MRKTRTGCFAAVLASTLILFTGSAAAEESDFAVNYINSEGTGLVERNYTAGNTEGIDLISELLEQMKNESSTGEWKSAIPGDVEIRDAAITGGSVVLDFNSAYYEMSAAEEILMRAAVVETLCQVPEVETVTFTVENVALVDAMGATVGTMDEETFIDPRGEGINSYEYAALSLYFASSDGSLIQKETRDVHYSTNITLEQVVLEELLAGPENLSLSAIASADTKVLSVSRKDTICIVNLDSSVQVTPEGSKVTPQAAIYAMVDALCDTCEVTEVQFLIDGESDVKFRDEVELSASFTRNAGMISIDGKTAAQTSAETEVLEPSVGADQAS